MRRLPIACAVLTAAGLLATAEQPATRSGREVPSMGPP